MERRAGLQGLPAEGEVAAGGGVGPQILVGLLASSPASLAKPSDGSTALCSHAFHHVQMRLVCSGMAQAHKKTDAIDCILPFGGKPEFLLQLGVPYCCRFKRPDMVRAEVIKASKLLGLTC